MVTGSLEQLVATWREWMHEGRIDEIRGLFAEALAAQPKPTPLRVRALYADGVLAFRQGAQAASAARNDEALAVARDIGDDVGVSLALVGLSRIALRDGDYERVCSLAREARELARSAGNRSDETAPLHLLAAGTRLGGDYDGAHELYTESLELNRALGNDPMIATELHNRGHVELHLGDLEDAERDFASCSELRAGSEDPYDRAMELLNAAALAAARGESFAGSLHDCERILADAGIALDPDDRFEVDELRARR